MINRSGPHIEPCGTPHLTDLISDCVPSNVTTVISFSTYSLSKDTIIRSHNYVLYKNFVSLL